MSAVPGDSAHHMLEPLHIFDAEEARQTLSVNRHNIITNIDNQERAPSRRARLKCLLKTAQVFFLCIGGGTLMGGVIVLAINQVCLRKLHANGPNPCLPPEIGYGLCITAAGCLSLFCSMTCCRSGLL